LNLVGPSTDSPSLIEREVLNEKSFKRMIAIERKRTERSQEPFLLMLVEIGDNPVSRDHSEILNRVIPVLHSVSRDTDVVGWYKDLSVIGVMFTGLVMTDRSMILSTILTRVSALLRDVLTTPQFQQVSLSFHFFPDEWDLVDADGPSNTALYPDLMNPGRRKRALLIVKRGIDTIGSALALSICLPAFAAIAVAIKLTSKGPVFFRQERIGQYGRPFTFLKFRSMYTDSDHAVHREYVTRLITDKAGSKSTQGAKGGIYKISNDSRVTPLGRFLRRTSLDELPQIINVLRGDMSLVGPRPPIPYELVAYQTWHRRRILDAKPGITGLWQVTARSLVKFDEMVRLDLRYAISWSLWLDFKILLRTPLAVIKGAGAC
jgi:lipopolysaccharide/colanic/teichoic acid biosynthesis glycosyltransferase